MYIGRFAPSPTGPLHFGSLVAALASWLDARAAGGRWLVRIEDLDRPREQPGAALEILDTLQSFGLSWDGSPEFQSARRRHYEEALARLGDCTYWCGCSRREIADSALGLAADGAQIYPGTCRAGLHAGKAKRALRAMVPTKSISFQDRVQGFQEQNLAAEVGDFVLLRADGLHAYQLAVVVDDAAQQVTDVVRGADLLESTARQVYLQRLLGYPQPRYLHVPAAVNAAGEKLSKQTGAPAIDAAGRRAHLAAALDFLGQPPADDLDSACTFLGPDPHPELSYHSSAMKISKVEALPLAIPYHIGEGRGGRIGEGSKLDFCLVRVETDAGLVGWGEAFSYHCRSAVVAAVRDMIAPLAVGEDALDIEGIQRKIQKRLHIFGRMGIQCYALSGLDIALWDIAAKAAGKPLHQLLGGAKHAQLPCYASLLRYADPELVAQYSERALREGFSAVKLHEVTERAVAAARRAIAKDTPLMVDVNCEWTKQAAIEAALSFAPHRLDWLEEPVFPPEDFKAMYEVQKAGGIALAAGENLCYAIQFEALLEANAITYAQPSVTKIGGISEFLKVVKLAAANGVRLAPHSPYFGPGAVATLHLIASQVPEARFEYFYLWAAAKPHPGILDAVNGTLTVPQGPGLGADPDPLVLATYRA